MTRNQLHGKKFEDWIKACGRFPGSADAGRSPTARFDIEARFDRERGLPTSVKATGNNSVALSDARGFWKIQETIRMIIRHYRQIGGRKSFVTVHEFILSAEMLNRLRGDISHSDVDRLHQGISIIQFPNGQHVQARMWVKEQQAALRNKRGHVILNPKIDSKAQRRVQCSVALSALIEICASEEGYIRHDERMGEFALPADLFSTVREFG
jgi:hypothetical protein